MFDRSLIVAILFLIWWFYPYLMNVTSVFGNLYFLYQSWKYWVPICIVVCLLCQSTTLNGLNEYFPLKKIITTIFVDDTYSPPEWQPSARYNPNYYNQAGYGYGYGNQQTQVWTSQPAYNYGARFNTPQFVMPVSQAPAGYVGPIDYGTVAYQPDPRRAVSYRRPLLRANVRRRQSSQNFNGAQLMASQSGLCASCHKPLGRRSRMSRIIPINQGGSLGPDNMQVLCSRCYFKK